MVTRASKARTRHALPIVVCLVVAGCASGSDIEGAATPAAATPKSIAAASATNEPIATPDAQNRTVVVTRGGSPADSDCSHPSCAHLDIEASGFAPNATVRVQPVDSVEGTDGWPPSTRTTNQDGSISLTDYYYYFGFPGRDVWVTVDGVESNRLTW